MAKRDLHNNITVKRAIDPQSISTNVATLSQIIDTLGYDELEFIIATGAMGTAGVFAVTIADGDSPTLADGAAVDPTKLLGTTAGASFTFSNASSQFRLGYIGGHRYVQLTITSTSVTGGSLFAVVAVLSGPSKVPAP